MTASAISKIPAQMIRITQTGKEIPRVMWNHHFRDTEEAIAKTELLSDLVYDMHWNFDTGLLVLEIEDGGIWSEFHIPMTLGFEALFFIDDRKPEFERGRLQWREMTGPEDDELVTMDPEDFINEYLWDFNHNKLFLALLLLGAGKYQQ